MKEDPNTRVLGRPLGHHRWEEWEKRALERGVDAEPASLGREVMREASQNGWDRAMRALCGWEDEGEAMIELALRAPKRARFVWEKLHAADGDQDAYHQGLDRWNPWER